MQSKLSISLFVIAAVVLAVLLIRSVADATGASYEETQGIVLLTLFGVVFGMHLSAYRRDRQPRSVMSAISVSTGVVAWTVTWYVTEEARYGRYLGLTIIGLGLVIVETVSWLQRRRTAA